MIGLGALVGGATTPAATGGLMAGIGGVAKGVGSIFGGGKDEEPQKTPAQKHRKVTALQQALEKAFTRQQAMMVALAQSHLDYANMF